MRRISHRRKTLPPAIRTVRIVIERLRAFEPLVEVEIVIILALRIEDLAESTLLIEIPRINARLAVIARLRHHVPAAGLLFDGAKLVGVFQAHTSGHRGNHVQAMLHAHLHVFDVRRGVAENRDRVQIVPFLQHVFERVIHAVATVGISQLGPAHGIEVGHRGDHAARMFMPMEAAAEPAAYHRHADLLPGGGLRRGPGLGCHSRGSHGAEEFSSIFHLGSYSFKKQA